jgi:basic amino acid/polyamine antiporter, APA family
VVIQPQPRVACSNLADDTSRGGLKSAMNTPTLLRTKSIEAIQRDAALGDIHGGNGGHKLARMLGVRDLTAFGIAAIIGAGIFSTIGSAAANGGPAVALLFVFTAIACGFAAICYAEFASMLPIAGSAYTYAYASFGEIFAWIIGWDLIVEYAIGNIAVAISWSDYFTTLVGGYGLTIPEYLTMDFLTAMRGFDKVSAMLAEGQTIDQVRAVAGMGSSVDAWTAWATAPKLGSLRLVCDLPALGIVVLVTLLVYIGIQESKRASNIMVAIKLAVILLVVAVGIFQIRPENWVPFAPNGLSGVLKGVSGVFFAYIGFDALSTTAEECRDPQRDLPRGMIWSLIICTVLYIAIALVLTGMVNYRSLAVGDPLAYVFGPEGVNIGWVTFIVAISAVVAMATVLLVFQLGQPRIWMAMSRDGLLPPIFASIHPRFRTPWFSTIITGLVVAIPSLFMNLTEVTDLASIGTLFAFVLVCGGVLILDNSDQKIERRFRTPYINGRYIVPALVAVIILWLLIFNRESVSLFFSLTDPADPGLGVWDVVKHKIPLLIYGVMMTIITWLSYRRSLSLIPVLGLMTCGYLMTELGWTNWARFIIWLVIGLGLYFGYGRKHSRLAIRQAV